MGPALSASGLSPEGQAFSAFFGEGQGTEILGNALPSCSNQLEPGSILELYNEDTGFIAGRYVPFNDSLGVAVDAHAVWDVTSFPALKATYTGIYSCRTNSISSAQTYQLHVRRKFTL